MKIVFDIFRPCINTEENIKDTIDRIKKCSDYLSQQNPAWKYIKRGRKSMRIMTIREASKRKPSGIQATFTIDGIDQASWDELRKKLWNVGLSVKNEKITIEKK